MRILRYLILMVLSLPAWSQGAGQNFPLLSFEISSHQLSSAFSAFIYFEGGEKHLKRVQQAVASSEQRFQALEDKPAGLQTAWSVVKAHVKRYESHVFNGVDMSLEGGWSLALNKLQSEIEALKAAQPVEADQQQSIHYQALSFNLSLENLLSQYMSIANSTTGGYGVSRGDLSIEDRVAMTETLLMALKKSGQNVDAVNRKWQYIKKTILAYNSNIAPFVVIHTIETIRKKSAHLLAVEG